MYVYVYVYAYMYILYNIHIYIYINIYIYTPSMYVCIQVCMYVCMYIHTQIYIYICVRIYTHKYIYIFIYIYSLLPLYTERERGRECESVAFYQLCHKSNLRFADSNWFQLIVPRSAKCLNSKMVKHCALTNVNSDRGFESWPGHGLTSRLP
jgi:hypothetical protein